MNPSSKIKFGLTILILSLSSCQTPKLTNQVAIDLKKKLDNNIEIQKVLRQNLRKQERVSRFTRRKINGRIRVFQYDFEKSIFSCNKETSLVGLEYTQSCAPPFEIDEMDGIRIEFKNVNPFLYTVNLYELQGDQISNENLSENNWNRNLTLNFDPIASLTIDRNALAVVVGGQAKTLINKRYSIQNQLTQLLGKHSVENLNKIIAATDDLELTDLTDDADLASSLKTAKEYRSTISKAQELITSDNDKILNLKKALKAVNDSINQLKDKPTADVIKKKVDSIQNQITALENNLSTQTKSIDDFTNKLKALQPGIQTRASIIKKNATDQLSQINAFQTQIDDLSAQLYSLSDLGLQALEKQVREYMSQIQTRVQELNEFVIFHNYLIYQVHVPENSHSILSHTIRQSLNKTLHLNENEVMPKFMSIRSNIYELLKNSNDALNELISIDARESQKATKDKPYTSNAVTYNNIRTTLGAFEKSFSDFNATSMIGQIDFMLNMLTEGHFSVVYETHSIAENADFVRYRAEFKPITLNDKLPQGASPFNLDFSFQVRNGWKYDVSSGFVLDLGLKDPSYYFDKTSDASGKTVTLRQNGDGGKITPSIAAFLNGYKRTSSNVKLGAAFGIGLSNNARFRLYLGPSIILGRKERVVISSGASFGAISRLADGYSVDQVLDNNAALPTNVPTVLDKFQLGGYFGIGFNLTGKQNQSFLQNLKFK